MNALLEQLGKHAKAAAKELRKMNTAQKDAALFSMATALREAEARILEANQQDQVNAQERGLPTPMIERLTLTPERVEAMARGIEAIASLPDPIGMISEMKPAEAGILIGKQRVPLGVIGIIYESRPNVTADAAALCFKAGNSVVLRGGKEAMNSNKAILDALQNGLTASGSNPSSIQLLTDSSRELAQELMRMNDYIDCLIPRGGAGLIQSVVQNATVPVIETGVGNCHLYIDKDAELEMATRILVNAKCDRPSVCNAIETLLVHKAVAEDFLPVFAEALAPYGVEIRGDERTKAILPTVTPATEEDFDTEFLDFTLSVAVVPNYEAAVAHIEEHSTGHSEVIVTDSYPTAQRFLADIDAAAVYVNASSRFTDGGCFGLGGEIGISTQKLHARGPMGLEALTSYKYIVYGEGQIRGTTGANIHF